jgi:hypothetical protein
MADSELSFTNNQDPYIGITNLPAGSRNEDFKVKESGTTSG